MAGPNTNYRANFVPLSDGKIELWARKITDFARDMDPFTPLEGGSDSVIQRLDDLSKSAGETVVTQAAHDLTDGGRVGDTEQEGREVPLSSDSMRTTIDRLSQQTKNTGELADQKTIFNFREQASNKLAYWAMDTLVQQRFHVLSGIDMMYDLSGAIRMDSTSDGETGPTEWRNLAWNADITAPSLMRHLRITGDTVSDDGDNAAITSADKLNYKSLVDACAFADEQYVKGIMDGNGEEYRILFLDPRSIANLKRDQDFLDAVVHGQPRSPENPFFSGTIKTVDGLAIRKHRHVYNNTRAPAGEQWGAAGDVPGTRALILGAQSMVHANVGPLSWVEKLFQYDSVIGFSTRMICGMRKTVYTNRHSTDANGKYLKEDLGVIALDMAR